MLAEIAGMKDIRALFHDKPEVSRVQIDALLEKHGFNLSRTIQSLDGNFTNQILRVETRSNGRVFLKMQFRRTRGFSLKAEFIATRALQTAADVPVSESLVYDGDVEPLPFECLLIPRESGESGDSYYSGASRAQRLQLGTLAGRDPRARTQSAMSGSASVGEYTRELASWEGTVRDALFGDAVLASSIEATLPELWDRLLTVMDSGPEVRIRGGNVFLWGEPGLHNVLVENGNSLRISNVHDFQSAGCGTAVHDLRQAEGEAAAKPGSDCYEPGYVDAFRSSYQAAIEKPVASLSAEEERLLAIVKNIRFIRFFWDCGRLLHPKTPEFLGASVSDLESLNGAESGG